MQENHLFEYAVIRVMPRVEREEFLNVGIILFCAKKKFLQTRFELNEDRLKALSAKIDLHEIQLHLQSFELICKGGKTGGPIGQLDIASRFRWLTATRSTVLQTSKPHPGLGEDPAQILEKLYNQLVL